MKKFIQLPIPGVKAWLFIRLEDIVAFRLNYGAEEEALVIETKDGLTHCVAAKHGVTMADLDAIVMDITGQ
jgi:hypothetical protein